MSLHGKKSTTGPNQRKHRKNDVRMVWEVDAISAKTNSTTQDVRKGGKKRITGDKQRKGLGTSRAKSFTVRRIWG